MLLRIILIIIVHINIVELNSDQVVYLGNAKSEGSLSTCKEHNVCNIIRKRFWFPNIVEKICRCESGINDCSSTWSQGVDNYTMFISNRAQMKFCEPVNQLPQCTDNGIGGVLKVVNHTIDNGESGESYNLSVNAECYCDQEHRWVEYSRSDDAKSNLRSYRCSEYRKCTEKDLCGYERPDTYETYYQCSCPSGYACHKINTNEYTIDQVLYNGPAYNAKCKIFNPNVINQLSNA